MKKRIISGRRAKQVRISSLLIQRLGLLPRMLFMALLMTLSWRFLPILGPERARCLSWAVAPHPADWALQ